MIIVLTNDDGYQEPSFQVILKTLSEMKEHKVYVLVPAEHQSGKSQSITLQTPLQFQRYKKEGFYDGYLVSGTPADCMLAGLPALEKYFNVKPDLVISGINNFANLGMDTRRSGTYGAAAEARLWGIPAIAVSDQWGLEPYESMEKRLSPYIRKLPDMLELIKGKPVVMNVNFPKKDIKGVKFCRVAPVVYYDFKNVYHEQESENKFTITYAQNKDNNHPGTDIDYCSQGYITVSVLEFNHGHYQEYHDESSDIMQSQVTQVMKVK